VSESEITEAEETAEPQEGADMPRRGKKHAVIILIVIGLVSLLAGMQSLLFFSIYAPRVDTANMRLDALTTEVARGDMHKAVQAQLKSLIGKAGNKSDLGARIGSALKAFNDDFNQAPMDKIKVLRSAIPAIEKGLTGTGAGTGKLVAALDRLQTTYTDPYGSLFSDLDAPPWYLQPLAGMLRNLSGYYDAVTLNRAMFLARTGELGTARVLLTGLYARARDPHVLGLVYYCLGRLQYERFATRPEPENYTQSVQYIRQSLQADPHLSLAKKMLDYLLSLSQAQGIPRPGKGEPKTMTEGSQGAITKEKPLF